MVIYKKIKHIQSVYGFDDMYGAYFNNESKYFGLCFTWQIAITVTE